MLCHPDPGSCCQEWTPSRTWPRFFSSLTEFQKSSNTSHFIVCIYTLLHLLFVCLSTCNVVFSGVSSVRVSCACVCTYPVAQFCTEMATVFYRERPSSVKLASVKHGLYHPLLPTLRRMDMDDVAKRLPQEHSRTSTPCTRG